MDETLARIVELFGPVRMLSFSPDERYVKRMKRHGIDAYKSIAFKTPGKRLFKLDLPDAFSRITWIPDCPEDQMDRFYEELVRVTEEYLLVDPKAEPRCREFLESNGCVRLPNMTAAFCAKDRVTGSLYAVPEKQVAWYVADSA